VPSWPYPTYEPQIRYYAPSNTWRCVVRKLPDGPYRSLEGPGAPIHTTPDAALAATVQRVADLLASRKEALAIEVIRLLESVPARLRPVQVPNPEPGGVDLRYWQARRDNGTWADPAPTSTEAVRIALGRTNDNGE
jgi:hypothetical protein